ncbi:MAG: hypothetical protein ACO1Q7_00105 [Gemmatimonas sp.]
MTDRSAPYGPQTAQIRRFLQALAGLAPEAESTVVARFGESGATAAYRTAERALADAIAKSGRERERDALGGPLLQMLRAPGTSEEASLKPMAEPALGALLALLMHDLLTPLQVAALYAPFDGIISRDTLG